MIRLRTRVRRLIGLERGPHPRLWLPCDYSLGVPFAFGPAAPTSMARRAMVLHLFHTEYCQAFLACAGQIPGRLDIFISTDTPAKAADIREVFANWTRGSVDVRVVENRGRDVAPKFVTFRDIYERYDLVLFLHSKKAVHYSAGGNDWRELLLRSLSGSSEIVASILSLFESDPTLGIVFPQHYEGVRDRVVWGANRSQTGLLAERMGIALDDARALDFVSGSMFWARPQALTLLFELKLNFEDFPAEAGQLDGTLAHAIERILLFAAEQAGFRWLKVADPHAYSNQSGILYVKRKSDLNAAMRRAYQPLLPPRRLLRSRLGSGIQPPRDQGVVGAGLGGVRLKDGPSGRSSNLFS
jgi:O-antigen biosynthesis protein